MGKRSDAARSEIDGTTRLYVGIDYMERNRALPEVVVVDFPYEFADGRRWVDLKISPRAARELAKALLKASNVIDYQGLEVR